MYPESFGGKAKEEQAPVSTAKGLIPAFKGAFQELKGQTALTAGKLGLTDETQAQKYYEAQKAKGYKPTEEGWLESPFLKTKELIGGSLPYVVAPLLAGVAAEAAPLTGLAALAAGAGATGLASAGQFVGSNLARQMEQGKSLKQTDLGAAALSAIPQAALDVVSLRMMPGLSKLLGVSETVAKNVAEQGLKRAALDYTMATGKAMGVEGLTESAQQVFERAQAGLSISDPEARKEYFDNFIGGAVLGGAIALPGRKIERMGMQSKYEEGVRQKGYAAAKLEFEKQQAEEDAKAQERAAALEEQKKPENLLKLHDDLIVAQQQVEEMKLARGKRPNAKTSDEDRKKYIEASQQIQSFVKDTINPLKKARSNFSELIDPLVEERAKNAPPVEEAAPPAPPVMGEAPPIVQQEEQQVPPPAPFAAPKTALETHYPTAVDLIKQSPEPIQNITPMWLSRQLNINPRTSKNILAVMENEGLLTPVAGKPGYFVDQDNPYVPPVKTVTPAAPRVSPVMAAADTHYANALAQIQSRTLAPNKTAVRKAFNVSENVATVILDRLVDANILQYDPTTRKYTDPTRVKSVAAVAEETEVAPPADFDVTPTSKATKPAPPVIEPGETIAPAANPYVISQMGGIGKPFQVYGEAGPAPEDIAELERNATRTYIESLQAAGRPLPPELAARLEELRKPAPAPAAPVETPAPETETPAAPKAYKQLKGGEQFDFVTKTAEKIDPNFTIRDRAAFHAFNPNGLTATKAALDDEIVKLVDEGLVPPGSVLAYGSGNSFFTRELAKYASNKTVSAKDLDSALAGLERHIAKAKAFIEESRAPKAETTAPAAETPAPETEFAVEEQPAEPEKPAKPPSIEEAPAPFNTVVTPIKTTVPPTFSGVVRGWFHQTSPAGLRQLLNNDGEYHPAGVIVTDNATFHSGQMAQDKNAVSVEFRPDSLSGKQQRGLPVEGGIYNTNIIAPQAIKSVSMNKVVTKRLPPETKAFLAENFDLTTANNGEDLTYKRKKPVKQETEPAPATEPKTEKPRFRKAEAPAEPAVETPAPAETVEPATAPQTEVTEPVVKRKKRVVKPTAPAQAAVAEETAEAATEPQGEITIQEAKTIRDAEGTFTRVTLSDGSVHEINRQDSNTGGIAGWHVVDGPLWDFFYEQKYRVSTWLADTKAEALKELVNDYKELVLNRAKPAAPVTTDEQRKKAEAVVNKLPGGKLVWQEGDLALVRAYSEHTGRPGYAPAKGTKYFDWDVDAQRVNFASVFTPEELAKLRQVKKDLEADEAEKHAKDPFIKHDANGLAFSENVPAEYRGIVEGWKKLLGIDARVYVTTIAEARANSDKFTGPHRAIGSAGLDPDERGSARYMSADDSYYITYTPSTSKTGSLEIIAHELGHVHEKNVFKKAPAETQAAIKADYEKWLASNKGKTAREHIEGLRAKTTGKTTEVTEGLQSKDLTSYWSKFGEWYADQVSRWATTTDKPLTVVEKFFAKLAAAMRRFYTNVMQQKYLPVQSIQKFLDGIAEAGEKNGGVAPAAAVEDEEFFSLGKAEASQASLGTALAQPIGPAPSFVESKAALSDQFKTALTDTYKVAARQKLIDQYASTDFVVKEGQAKGLVSDVQAGNMQYAIRYGQQHNQYAGLALTHGPLTLQKQKTPNGVQFTYESKPGANLMQVAQELEASGLDKKVLEDYFTTMISGQRAMSPGIGWEKLNLENPAQAAQRYKEVMAIINASPQAKAAFAKASDTYRKFNHGLVDFARACGYFTEAVADELKSRPFVPFYRVEKDGSLYMDLDKVSRPVRLGNIKNQPRLIELVGGTEKIKPIFESAAQNAFLLTNLSLGNKARQEVAATLKQVGVVSRIAGGKGPGSTNALQFRIDGKDTYAVIDKDTFGIPASLIVQGLEGVTTMVPLAYRIMGIPANLLRKFVTRFPAYALRQALRDPLNAFVTSGADGIPILNSLKQAGKMVAGRGETAKELLEAGAIGNAVFTGDQRDAVRLLEQISTGKSGWTKAMAKLDAFAMAGDALTRASIYEDSISKGFTKQEALLRTLESQNFTRRGTSASMQNAGMMIPFLNAQVQGLDVLYRASGPTKFSKYYRMPFDERVRIRDKFYKRAAMLIGSTAIYTTLMMDDDRYRRAKPEERYGNWFIVNPLDPEGDLIRVPIPFEVGILFKAIPEALINVAFGDETADNALKGMGKLLEQSNPFSFPTFIKPAVEVVLNRSFFGGDIESTRELKLEKAERVRPGTTGTAALLGQAGILSPIQIDHLIRGYTGSAGIFLADTVGLLFPTKYDNVERPTKEMHELPLIGSMFQNARGRGIVDAAYDRMAEIQRVSETYKLMISEGRKEEAQEYLNDNLDEAKQIRVSGQVEKYLGELAKQKRQVMSSPKLTTEQKDVLLKRIDDAQDKMAKRLLTAS